MNPMEKWWAPSAGFRFYGRNWILFTDERCGKSISKGFCLQSASSATVKSQSEEVTNCSDKIPFYNVVFSNKIPPKAVCQHNVFRAVCALFREREQYANG